MSDRPEEVPEDWIQVDCDNPACPYTAWVPDVGQTTGEVPVLNVCSGACAIQLTELMSTL